MNVIQLTREKEILSFSTTQIETWEYYAKWNKPEKDIYDMVSLIRGFKKKSQE